LGVIAFSKKTTPSQAPPVLLTVKEAAALLRVTPRFLYQLIAEQRIPHRRIGRAVRFERAELLAWTKQSSSA
jgi:excisionase family DNA binding protein